MITLKLCIYINPQGLTSSESYMNYSLRIKVKIKIIVQEKMQYAPIDLEC